jgi:hypothetical protein
LTGTLKSTRTSTRLSPTSRSLTPRLFMVPPSSAAFQLVSTLRLRLRLSARRLAPLGGFSARRFAPFSQGSRERKLKC